MTTITNCIDATNALETLGFQTPLGVVNGKVSSSTGSDYAYLYIGDNTYTSTSTFDNSGSHNYCVTYDGSTVSLLRDNVSVVSHTISSIGTITVARFAAHNYSGYGWINPVSSVDNLSISGLSLYQAPVISSLTNQTINEGDTYTAVGSFTDSDSTSWTATVDYGDGSGVQQLSLSGTNFSLSHLYKDNGTYTVTVSITDNQGATGTQTATVTVNNVAPTVGTVSVSPSPAHINSAVTASASFTDVGVLDTHTATWDWGDGSTPSSGTVTESNGSGSVVGTHTYTTFGTFAVMLTVKDKDNATGQNSTPETVVKQLTVLDPATVYISKGALNILNRYNIKAEVYKNSTLITSGEIDNVNPGTSATAKTIPFNSFSPVDFPSGSALKIKVSACSSQGLGIGTATLHYNASTVDSKFGATIGTANIVYYLLNGFVLGTSAGTSDQTATAQSRCSSSFTSFGT